MTIVRSHLYYVEGAQVMNKSWIQKATALTLMISLTIPAIGFGGATSHAEEYELKQAVTSPTFSNVSVHDPSIIKAGGTFYVFGSHISAAKSQDLMNWTSFANGYTTPGNTIYGDLSKNLAGSFKWAGENDADSKGGFSVWAPDVIWNPKYVNADGTKGAYTIYYCTSSTYIRSAIGMAVSQKIEGPYTYVDTMIYSGFTKDKAFDNNSTVDKKWTNTNIQTLINQKKLSGESSAWFNADGTYANQNYPNAIDPTIFSDTKGKLWMTYGSWSGGIFVLEIDAKTGKPIYPGKDGQTKDGRLIDRYFGTKVAGGYGQSGEGPYIQYNKESGYYYLYMTYGGLAANGGYNMRVFRATKPDGPYQDAKGQQATWPAQTSNVTYGNKLIGNYLWDSKVGDPGYGENFGYVSPGHNSVYTDDKTGQTFLVFHTRFPARGEEHELRIHQMYINKEGWPVVSPYRYAGETLAKVSEEMVVGDYQFIDHGNDSSAAIKNTQYIRLNKDRTISGELQGTWQKKGTADAILTIDGVKYTGVFVKDWNPVTKQYNMTFTALSTNGTMGWGSRLVEESDKQVVADVYSDLSLGDVSNVISNVQLPTVASRGTSVVWTSSNPAVVSNTGVVTRPQAGQAPANVTLTASISKGNIKQTKVFQVTVQPFVEATLTAQYSFEHNLKDTTATFGQGTVTGDRLDSTVGTITYGTGVSGQSAVFNGTSGIRLPQGLISNNSYSVAVWVKPDQLTTYSPAFFGAKDTDHWVSLIPRGATADKAMVWSGTAWYDGVTGVTIPANQWTHLAFSVDEGSLTIYVNGVQQFSGTNFPDIFTGGNASFGLGVNYWDTPFKGQMDELRIYEGSLTPAQLSQLAKS